MKFQCYLHVVHLNTEKNNNIGVLCTVVVSAMSRNCVNSPNLFCYVNGESTPKSQTKSVTPVVKKAYELYSVRKFWNQDKLCTTFMSQQMFAIFTWLAHWHSQIHAFRSPCGVERTERSSYGLVLLFNKIYGHNSKAKYTILYPNIS